MRSLKSSWLNGKRVGYLWEAAVIALLAQFAQPAGAAETATSATLWSVQCAYQPPAEARGVHERLVSAGFGPVWEKSDGDRVRVLAGKCLRRSDAQLLMVQIRRAGFTDAFPKKLPGEGASITQSEITFPEAVLFPKGAAKHAAREGNLDFSLRADLSAFHSAVAARELEKATSQGLQLINGLLDSDPAKGWAAKEWARASLRSHPEGSEAAIQMLQKAARGEIASMAADLPETRMLLADAIHYYARNPGKAYLAYRELLSGGNPSARETARLRVEELACLLELAHRERGTYAETRRAAQAFLKEIPAEYARARATADLMLGETYLYEGNRKDALRHYEGFETRHPGRLRETAMVNLIRGTLLVQEERPDEARVAFEKVLAADLSRPEENFFYGSRCKNLKKLAARRLEFMARQTQGENASQTARDYLKELNDSGDAPAFSRDAWDTTSAHKIFERTQADDASKN